MISNKFVIALLQLTISAMMSSCNTASSSIRSIHVEIENIGGTKISEAHVYFGKKKSVGGDIGPSGSVGHGFFATDLPEKFIVSYRASDGEFIEKEFETVGKVTPGKKGYITIRVKIVGEKKSMVVDFLAE